MANYDNRTIPFAIFNEELVDIHDERVVSGKSCGCFCPGCNEPLVANKGKLRQFFSHQANGTCAGGYESAVHLAVKKVLNESDSLVVPDKTIDPDGYDKKGRRYRRVKILLEGPVRLQIASAQMEKRLDDIQPDVLVETDRGRIALEVLVTHAVDDTKKAKLKNHELPTLELTFSDRPDDLSFKAIRTYLEDLTRLNWAYYPGANELEQRLQAELDNEIAEANRKIELAEQQRLAEEKHHQEIRKQERQRLIDNLERAGTTIRSLLEEQQHQPESFKQNMLKLAQFKSMAYSRVLNWFERETLVELPDYVNIELPGELTYLVDRRLWQGLVYAIFVQKTIDKPERHDRVLKNASIADYINRNFDIKPAPFSFDVNNALRAGLSVPEDLASIPTSYRLIESYLSALQKRGILKSVFRGYQVIIPREEPPTSTQAKAASLADPADKRTPIVQNSGLRPAAGSTYMPGGIQDWFEKHPQHRNQIYCVCGNIYPKAPGLPSQRTPCSKCGLTGNLTYIERKKRHTLNKDLPVYKGQDDLF